MSLCTITTYSYRYGRTSWPVALRKNRRNIQTANVVSLYRKPTCVRLNFYLNDFTADEPEMHLKIMFRFNNRVGHWKDGQILLIFTQFISLHSRYSAQEFDHRNHVIKAKYTAKNPWFFLWSCAAMLMKEGRFWVRLLFCRLGVRSDC